MRAKQIQIERHRSFIWLIEDEIGPGVLVLMNRLPVFHLIVRPGFEKRFKGFLIQRLARSGFEKKVLLMRPPIGLTVSVHL